MAAELLKITGQDFQTAASHHDRLAKTIYYNLLQILVLRLRKHNQELDLNLDVMGWVPSAVRLGRVKAPPP
ncbi:MAG TPA: hypothetical protein VES89_00275 [Candidatus Competibacteraceae bacterium]|nr:hypothetical protein [Candidatus Competibacteraceae bacterium]